MEQAGGALAGKYLRSGQTELAIDLRGSGLSGKDAAALLLGLRLRGWSYDNYRTKMKDDAKVTLARVTVVGAPDGTDAAWLRAEAVATGVEFARELVTEPANIIYPVSFVERCQARFEGTGAELIVLDDAQMAEIGMGALLGVGLGSERDSRILAIRWNGDPAGGAPTAFVGKGVTFDTGGISLKPGAGMEDMKWDMGGSAAVVGAMLSLVRRKAKVNVVGVVGLVENMPDGKAQRPGRRGHVHERPDHRGHQHRCGRPARALRRAALDAAGIPAQPHRRFRHADGRDDHRLGPRAWWSVRQ
jgi:leucyl aminopeptidase